jgi:hypothetical protein
MFLEFILTRIGVGKRYSLIDVDEKEITANELAQKYFRSSESCFDKGYPEEENEEIVPSDSNNVQTDLYKEDIVEYTNNIRKISNRSGRCIKPKGA